MIDYPRLRSLIEVERTVHFWGQDEQITPLLVERVLGEGDLLMSLAPINTRPNHYIIRVPSAWWPRNGFGGRAFEPFEDEGENDRLEEIYQAIEEQFGNENDPEYDDEDNEIDKDAPDYEYKYPWPKLSGGGSCWGWWQLLDEFLIEQGYLHRGWHALNSAQLWVRR